MKKSYTLSLEKKEWNNCLHDVYDKKKKDIKIDGFRKGQVPYDVYTKKAGVESLYMDAIDAAVDILYAKLLSDKETITPAATPSIDIKNISKDMVEIEFTIVGAPEVKLGKYKSLGIKKEEIKVTEEEVEHELNHLKEHFVDEKVAELGDATLVNSNKIENENVVENSVEQEISKEVKQEKEEVVKPTNAETTPKEDTYFTTSKLERENIYSQMLETYQEIYNNANSTQEQKEKAIEEIAKINERRNAIMIAENLILAKGIENVVIFANENSVSVIAKAETLEPEKIAQIQNIVSRELEVGAEIISISTK